MVFSTKPIFINRIEDRNGNVIKRFDYGMNRKAVLSEATAYQMCKMMEGPVTIGTASGLMQRLGAKEMGGKTGTTNDNADAWFMGFSPQLLAGVWIGSDDRFISIESAQGFGGAAARPIWEAFFKKVYANPSLGITKDALFDKPADLENQINSADMFNLETEGIDYNEDNGTNPDDYSIDTTTDIPAESQLPEDDGDTRKDNRPPPTPRKDSARTAPPNRRCPSGKKREEGNFEENF